MNRLTWPFWKSFAICSAVYLVLCVTFYAVACAAPPEAKQNQAKIQARLIIEGQATEACPAKFCSEWAMKARPGYVIEEVETLTESRSFLKVLHVDPPAREVLIEPGSGLGDVVSFTQVPIDLGPLMTQRWKERKRMGEMVDGFKIKTELFRPAMTDPAGGGGYYVCTYQQRVNAACGFNGCIASANTTCWQGDSGNDSRCRNCR